MRAHVVSYCSRMDTATPTKFVLIVCEIQYVCACTCCLLRIVRTIFSQCVQCFSSFQFAYQWMKRNPAAILDDISMTMKYRCEILDAFLPFKTPFVIRRPVFHWCLFLETTSSFSYCSSQSVEITFWSVFVLICMCDECVCMVYVWAVCAQGIRASTTSYSRATTWRV